MSIKPSKVSYYSLESV